MVPPIHNPQCQEIGPDAPATGAFADALVSTLSSSHVPIQPLLMRSDGPARAPHAQQDHLRPLLHPELPQLLDLERTLFGARRGHPSCSWKG